MGIGIRRGTFDREVETLLALLQKLDSVQLSEGKDEALWLLGKTGSISSKSVRPLFSSLSFCVQMVAFCARFWFRTGVYKKNMGLELSSSWGLKGMAQFLWNCVLRMELNVPSG